MGFIAIKPHQIQVLVMMSCVRFFRRAIAMLSVISERDRHFNVFFFRSQKVDARMLEVVYFKMTP